MERKLNLSEKSRAEHNSSYSLQKEYRECMTRINNVLEEKYIFDINNYTRESTVLC